MRVVPYELSKANAGLWPGGLEQVRGFLGDERRAALRARESAKKRPRTKASPRLFFQGTKLHNLAVMDKEIRIHQKKISWLANKARYKSAYALSKKLMLAHPDVLEFAISEAVLTAEEESGFSRNKIDRRYADASKN